MVVELTPEQAKAIQETSAVIAFLRNQAASLEKQLTIKILLETGHDMRKGTWTFDADKRELSSGTE